MLQLSKDWLKSGALASIAKTMDSTNLLRTKITPLGFDVSRVRLSMAVNPTLSMEICPRKDCDWKALTGLADLEELDTAQQTVVSVLSQLSEVRAVMQEKEYELLAIELVLGLASSVHLSFRPIHSLVSPEGDNVIITTLF
ncbi:hypothetical protein BASA81_010031 [Batrachochytrium salamandrivorans]|nr:hypothetical protein BASA81_010031 [Batrachochytrium salamandrivorans]